MPYLMKAKETDPDNLDIRIKVAHVFILAGKVPESREELEFHPRKRPAETRSPDIPFADRRQPGGDGGRSGALAGV